jgi:hypothetical protein
MLANLLAYVNVTITTFLVLFCEGTRDNLQIDFLEIDN